MSVSLHLSDMNGLIRLFIIINCLINSITLYGGNRIVLNSKYNIQHQLQEKNAKYIVKNGIDLQGDSIIIPMGAELIFKRKGTISNGVIVGNNTSLKGRVKLLCELAGSFSNDEIPVSWLCISDRTLLSKQISSIFNLNRPCIVKLDKDITMDGTLKNVAYIALSGKKRIRNSCRYKVGGDVLLHGVSFDGFESYWELFLDLRGITEAVTIDISDIRFDGCWNTSRFLYCPYKKIENASTINISLSNFLKIKNYVVQFRPSCKGRIRDNKFENIGTDDFSNVIGLHLGDSSDDEERLCAFGFEISNNFFKDFKIPYNDMDDGREAHALLLFGHNNIIRGNHIIYFYSPQMTNGDPGRDCEGIYLKGGENVVEDNYLVNCVGSGPDGAITIKSSYSNNRVIGNTVRHQYGLGIQCYTSSSVIEGNIIYSDHNAEAGIAMLVNKGSIIEGNEFHATDGKAYHSAIALTSCEEIKISGNQFYNTGGILTTYKCKGVISFNENQVDLKEKIYGTNTYYTAPFELHDDIAEYILRQNKFTMEGVRTSQLIEAPEGFRGKVVFRENELDVEDSKEVKSLINYLVRNVKMLTVEQNTENSKVKRIKTVSNLNNRLTLGNN